MRKLIFLVLALACLGAVAAKLNISEPQAITAGVLSNLNFERLPNDTKLVGAPPKFTVSKKTLEFLKKYEGKTIEVASDGSLEIEEQ